MHISRFPPLALFTEISAITPEPGTETALPPLGDGAVLPCVDEGTSPTDGALGGF